MEPKPEPSKCANLRENKQRIFLAVSFGGLEYPSEIPCSVNPFFAGDLRLGESGACHVFG